MLYVLTIYVCAVGAVTCGEYDNVARYKITMPAQSLAACQQIGAELAADSVVPAGHPTVYFCVPRQ